MENKGKVRNVVLETIAVLVGIVGIIVTVISIVSDNSIANPLHPADRCRVLEDHILFLKRIVDLYMETRMSVRSNFNVL